MLMKDDVGLSQIWLASPVNDKLQQLTFGHRPIASAFTFRSDGRCIACVIGDAVCEVNVFNGSVTALTEPMDHIRAEACVYSPDGRRVAFTRTQPIEGLRFNQICVCETTI
jgi:hypothetical protein